MRITVPALIISAIAIYRLAAGSHGGKESALVSVLLLVALVYKFCANGRERAARELVDTGPRSDDGCSVEEWMRIRRLGQPAEAEPAPPPATEGEVIPVTHASADPVRPPRPTWALLGGRLILATVVMVGYLMWVLSFTVVFIPYYRDHTNGAATRATVTERSLIHQRVNGNDWYSPSLRIRYQAGDVTREQWCVVGDALVCRSIGHPAAQHGMCWHTDRARAENDAPYEVGSVVRAWYQPDQPAVVVVPNSQMFGGAVLLDVLIGVVLFAASIVPVSRLFRRWWVHRFVFYRATGRVLRGEVRSRPVGLGSRHYYAVLFLRRPGRESAPPLTIEWGTFWDESEAVAELGQILATHQIDQTTPVWFDPEGRYSPSFELFGVFKVLVSAAALVAWAPATLITLPFQVISKVVGR